MGHDGHEQEAVALLRGRLGRYDGALRRAWRPAFTWLARGFGSREALVVAACDQVL